MQSSSFNFFQTRLQKACGKIETFLKSRESDSNIKRRFFYSEVELLRLDIDEYTSKPNADDTENIDQLYSSIDTLISKLDLIPHARLAHWWDSIDYIFRALGITMGIISISIYVALPLILLRPLDDILTKYNVITRRTQISEYLKRKTMDFMLTIAGISVTTEGLNSKIFEDSSVILTFSHASNLDGYFVSKTCPVRHVALAKKEIFLVPFLSWISFAMGGMPVDRSNRERAIEALNKSSQTAQHNKICIVIAPEGTRSKTGQLLPFKKGTFYIYDKLRIPIVPMLIFGANDLYPVDTFVNMTGKVVIRYLNPIMPHEASSKEEMLRLVRRRMLQALQDCPTDICKELTWMERSDSVCYILCLLSVDLLSIRLASYYLFSVLGCSLSEVLLMTVIGSVSITLGLYAYFVYFIDYFRREKKGKKIMRKNSESTDKKVENDRSSKKPHPGEK